MYAAATTAHGELFSVAYRYTTQHFAGALLGPAGSMCCRYAGDATYAHKPADRAGQAVLMVTERNGAHSPR